MPPKKPIKKTVKKGGEPAAKGGGKTSKPKPKPKPKPKKTK